MLSVKIKKQLTHFMLDVDFSVGEEIVALYGPSGSGKTTTLHAIAGLLKPQSGSIYLNNRTLFEAGKANIDVAKRKVGYVFQQYALFPHMTVWENIQYGMKRESLALNLLNELQMSHLKEQYPREISGGERQRTALIRALATEPDILLLDEPFSALDDETKAISYEQVLALHQRWEIPIVLVTHNKEEVKKLANKVIYLREGKVFTIEDKNSIQTN